MRHFYGRITRLNDQLLRHNDGNCPVYTEADQVCLNVIEFFCGLNRPHLSSESDDFTIKIWDSQTKIRAMRLSGHQANVTALKVHFVHLLLLSALFPLVVWRVCRESRPAVLRVCL
jgi:WD40 repeat protein